MERYRGEPETKHNGLLLFTVDLVIVCQVLRTMQERQRHIVSHQRAYICAQIAYLL